MKENFKVGEKIRLLHAKGEGIILKLISPTRLEVLIDDFYEMEVGIGEVVKAAYPDPTAESGTWVSPDIRALEPLKKPVALAEAKIDPALKGMVLVNYTRLSVQPVTDAEWKHICKLGGVKP